MAKVIDPCLNVPAGKVTFILKLDSGLVSIGGNSASGKTYLYNTLNDGRITGEYPKVMCYALGYDPNKLIGALKEQDGKIIIIDNADVLLPLAGIKDGKLFIEDESNQYILLSRDGAKYGVKQRDLAILDQGRDGTIGLYYPLR